MYSEHSAAIAAPPQRRRRPALACLQCRRRKVKCDQNNPCSRCQRSKDAICTYSSDPNLSWPSGSVKGHDVRARYQLESILQFPALGSSAATTSAAHSPHSNVTSRFAESDSPESRAIIAKYPPVEGEQTAPASIHTPDIERHVTDRESIPDSSLGPRQYLVKPKLFGENHWMNHFTQVGSSHI